MKTPILACLTASLCATAYATPADDLANAVRPLAAAPNCTWIITPDPKLARPVQTEWRGNREGWQIGRVLDRNELSSVSDGRRRFNRLPGKPWVEVAGEPKPGHVPADRPATVADFVLNLVAAMRNVRQDGDALVAEFSTESLARELNFGHGDPTNVSGWARFWIKDGVLLRYQTHREGTIRDRKGSRRLDATTEVAFTNLGSTEVVVPPDLRQLFDT